jgi:hypothetical protein
MKLIKILITLSLLSLCFTIENVEKTERTEKSSSTVKRARTGVQSKMARVFSLSFYVGTSTEASIGSIDAKTIKAPKDENTRGIEITFTKINEDIKPLLYQVGSKWYLPYRKLAQAFQIQEINNGGKLLTSEVLASKDHLYALRVQFEFDAEWEVITDAELNTLVTWMNKNRTDRRSIVGSLKILALQYAGEYKSATEAARAADSGIEAVTAQIAASTKLISETETLKKTTEDSLVLLIKSIEQQQLVIDRLGASLVTSKKQLDLYDSMIIEKQKSNFRLSTDAGTGKTNAGTYNAAMDKAETGFRNGIANLQVEVGNPELRLAQATNKLFNDKDLAGCNTLIRQVFSQ